MTGSINWLLRVGEYGVLFVPALLLAKVTILLALAWCAHGMLRRANPRWRVLLWRAAGIGMVLLIALAACPPIISWSVLPPAAEPSAPLASHNGRSSEPAEETASRVMHGESTATMLAEDPQPADQGYQEGCAAPQPAFSEQASTMSEVDAPEAQPVEPAIALPPVPTWRRSTLVLGAIGAVWLIGLLGLAAWTLVGLRRLRAIVSRSQPAPEWIEEQADHAKQRLGCKRSVVVRTTAKLSTPCLVGIWRPVILLPETQVASDQCEELSAILLHETAHLNARDLLWNAVMYVLSLLFWPHPLAWRIRLAHANACETVADAVAANHVGDVAHYVRTLARLAVQMHRPAPGTALAMAGMSSVMQRIETLQRKLFLTRLPRGRMALVVLLATFGMGLLGGIALTRATAEPQETETAIEEVVSTVGPNQEMAQLVVHATEAETGKPLEGVRFLFWGGIDGESYKQQTFTDERGEARVSWKAGGEIDHMFATWSKSGYVSQHHYWNRDRQLDIELPTELQLKFDAGHTIRGIVQDEEGRPIEGAQVDPHMHWPWRQSYVFRTNLMLDAEGRTRSEIVTDAEGRWQWDGAPEDLSQAQIDITCPGYLDWMSGCRYLGAVCVLKRGDTVSGRVVNVEGQPIEGADVRIGEDKSSRTPKSETQTDAAGRFVFENCPREDSVITVLADGHSPQRRKVAVGEEEDVGDIQLGPPNTVRIRVVDREGKPLQGAKCYPTEWRDHRGLKADLVTDAEGCVQWQSAPEDGVLWSIYKEGYMSVRRTPLEPSDKEHAIKMDPELVLRGRVTDAVTDEPLPAFEIIEGRLRTWGEEPWWSDDAPVDYQDGSYEFRFKYPIEGRYLLRVSAPGYEPVESRPIAMDEGAVTLDLALKPVEAPVKPRETKDNASRQNRLVIQATAKDTGKPLAGVRIRCDGRLDQEGFGRKLETDDAGVATFQWDEVKSLERLNLSCAAEGYVPMRREWTSGQDKAEAPRQILLQFEPGKWIGGIVQNEDGQPIEGATITLQTSIGSPGYVYWTVADLKTGADGRWSWKGAGSDLSYFLLDIEHPEYVHLAAKPTAGTEVAYVLKRGHRLTGRVLTTDGTPIEGAGVLLGHYLGAPTQGVTDSDGRFVLKNCPANQSLLTVRAEGFSPDIREIAVGEQEDLGEFRLAPGTTLRLRVVDQAGAPIAGTHFSVNSWRGHNTVHHYTTADEEGRIVWSDAPGDEVLCDIYTPGYLDRRRVPLQASEVEQTIVLSPELVIRGNVTDADTGRPIPFFTVCPGESREVAEGVRWWESLKARHENGAYTLRIGHPTEEGYRLQVVAPGHFPMVSRPFKLEEGDVTLDFALRPAVDLAGTVLDPTGKPVAQAQVGLAKDGTEAWLEEGHFSRIDNRSAVVTTNEAGEFSFPPQGDERFLLIATHDSGFAQVTPEQFAESPQIRLEPWGRIEGEVLLGDGPDANRTVWFVPQRNEDDRPFVNSWKSEAVADSRGRFQIDRAIPGLGSVGRVVTWETKTRARAHGWQQAIDVPPGETRKVTIGGTGRPVIGQLHLDDEDEKAVDWTTNHVVRLRRLNERNDNSQKPYFGCIATIDKEGRFEIPDVPPGMYQLICRVTGRFSRRSRQDPPVIGIVEHVFTVPPLEGERSDEPIDLSVLPVARHQTPQVHRGPVLTIEGKVTDAKTGLPIPSFTVRRGVEVQQPNSQVFWSMRNERRYNDGTYQFNIDQPNAMQHDCVYWLRVEASGYHPKLSRAFKPDEEDVTFDFALEPGTNIVGTVLDAKGNAAAGAQVGLAKADSRVCLNNGEFYDAQNQAQVVETDVSGSFVFSPQGDGPFLLVVADERGFAKVTREQFEESPTIQLQPWGRIEGQVLLGDKPDANRSVSCKVEMDDATNAFIWYCHYRTEADAEGRFEVDRVVPGLGSISRTITIRFPVTADQPLSIGSVFEGWHQLVNVTPNKTTKVTIGGTGRPVVGRLELDRDPGIPTNWTTNDAVAIHRWDVDKDQADEETFRCCGKIDEFGRFEIPDVPPGDYRLKCRVWGAFVPGSRTYPPTLGNAKHDFTVPPLASTRTDEPLDLGTITVAVDAESQKGD